MVCWRALVVIPPLLLAACGAERDGGPVSAESNYSEESPYIGVEAMPPIPPTMFDQAKVCTNALRSRAGFREVDLAEGVLRWNCGDVNGVTVPDLGQEYCEFHALLNGRVVDDAVVRPEAGDAVECLFTSVFADAKGSEGAMGQYRAMLAKQVAPQLKKAASVESAVTTMQVYFNTRNAARYLIEDCAMVGREQQLDAQRQAACVVAWSAADEARKADLELACMGVDLSTDRGFAKAHALGVTPKLEDENERDLAACTLVKRAPRGGRGWRNSDPSICGRTARAAACGYDFADIPDSATGFELKGWTNRDALPVGCRYLEVNEGAGKKVFPYLVACVASAADVDEYNRARKPLQMMCRDKFGINLALQAPLRALTTKDASFTSTETAAFCDAFAGASDRAGVEPGGG